MLSHFQVKTATSMESLDLNPERLQVLKSFQDVRSRLHVPPMTPFLVPFKSGFNAVTWCYLHVMPKRSKVLVTKMVTLTARVKEPLN